MINKHSLNSFDSLQTLSIDGQDYSYFSLKAVQAELGDKIQKLPFSLKILLENLLRNEDGSSVSRDDIQALANWLENTHSEHEISFSPARVLMQDFTGVPAVVDLAAMRDALAAKGGDPALINPQIPVDLVIDHSVMVDQYGNKDAFDLNVKLEMQRNKERYIFLRWGQQAFDNFRVVPPGTGICHQVNLEYLGEVVWQSECEGHGLLYPDTLVGTDSHTTMINGLAVLGWGVGGIEAEAAMLGQPISMRIPDVVGMRLEGRLREGVTATDLVLTITERLRQQGVVGKFVEFYGSGLDELPLPDRATIANMAPEYGATCGLFPIDDTTLRYLRLSGRPENLIKRVETYAKAQGIWRDSKQTAHYSDTLTLILDDVEPSLAGPKRPQDRIRLGAMAEGFASLLQSEKSNTPPEEVTVAGKDFSLSDGDIVIAAITSCTNTSNPAVMMAAGLLARNAVKRGLKVPPWVKTSLAPGSQVVTDYLQAAGLQEDLNQLGFQLVGYGCTTCIGNSGPLAPEISGAIRSGNLIVGSVLSGNRNFEGRINPDVRANYLASPPLVVAYALAGNLNIDLKSDPIGNDPQGNPVYLNELWPSTDEIQSLVEQHLRAEQFQKRYGDVFSGSPEWQQLPTKESKLFAWPDDSSYIRHPPYFMESMQPTTGSSDIRGARLLLRLGDSVTTDHISPAGAIPEQSAAGEYLIQQGISKAEFNSFGSRRGNHEVMMRGTFANIRLRNQLAPGTQGGFTRHMPSGEQMSVYDAAMRYREQGVPTVVVAGKEYGTGSSRDWAAKGTRLLGIRAVIAQSFERIHRSNLVGMGVLPLMFMEGENADSLGIGAETEIDILELDSLAPGQELTVVRRNGSDSISFGVKCRIDTLDELAYYRSGGILSYVLEQLAQ